MSSRALFLAVLAVTAWPLGAQDWQAYAARSDRSMDPFLIQNLAAADLETGIAICRGLGRRPDLDVQAEIDFLLSQRTPARSAADTEVMLRWLVASATEAHPRQEELAAWVAANAPQVDRLLESMPRWKDAQLEGALLALAVIAPGTSGTAAIMEVAREVIRRLKDSPDGTISPQDTALALDVVNAARQAGKRVFFEPCVQIARLSRDKTLVDAARAAARELSTAP